MLQGWFWWTDVYIYALRLEVPLLYHNQLWQGLEEWCRKMRSGIGVWRGFSNSFQTLALARHNFLLVVVQ